VTCGKCKPHVHGRGCGHWQWPCKRSEWFDKEHPGDCPTCQKPSHTHGEGCGHFHWKCKNEWLDSEHFGDCSKCGHVHKHRKCGHFFWHGKWNNTEHDARGNLCSIRNCPDKGK
jgi:hypothetical protein